MVRAKCAYFVLMATETVPYGTPESYGWFNYDRFLDQHIVQRIRKSGLSAWLLNCIYLRDASKSHVRSVSALRLAGRSCSAIVGK